MPYGIPRHKGGDSEKNVQKMERCISHVMGKDRSLSKQSAIRICKANLFKGRTKEE